MQAAPAPFWALPWALAGGILPMGKESCFRNSFGPRVSLHLHSALEMMKRPLSAPRPPDGGRGEGIGSMGLQTHCQSRGLAFFGNLCQAVLRCLQVSMVILSFPKGAPQERAVVGTSPRCLPRDGDGGRCVRGGGSREPPQRTRRAREAAVIRTQH